jgi:hypothetical protein
MRTRTGSEVKRWLAAHRDEALKILKEIDISSNDLETCADTRRSKYPRSDSPKEEFNGEKTLSVLLQSLLITDLSFKKKLDGFCSLISDLFDVEKCAIFLLNRDNNMLEVIADKEWGAYVSVNMSQGVVGRSAFINETIFVKDPRTGIVYN